MKTLCRLRGGRWSAVLSKVELGIFGNPELDLQVKVYHGRVEVMCCGFCPDDKRTTGLSGEHNVFEYLELFEFNLSDVDVEDIKFLMRVTDRLCRHLHRGGLATEWCIDLGLRCIGKRNLRRRRNRRNSLLIKSKGRTFVLSPRPNARRLRIVRPRI